MRSFLLSGALCALLLLACCAPQQAGTTGQAPGQSTSASAAPDSPAEPPEIAAAIGGSAIPTLYRAEHWDGTIQCGTDLVTAVIRQHGADTPAGTSGAAVTVTFPEGGRPERVRILLEGRDADGLPVGDGAAMTEADADAVGTDGSVTFTLPAFQKDCAYTGVLIEAVWGENNAWYALALADTGATAALPEGLLPLPRL